MLQLFAMLIMVLFCRARRAQSEERQPRYCISRLYMLQRYAMLTSGFHRAGLLSR